MKEINEILNKSRLASKVLPSVSDSIISDALKNIAQMLDEEKESIVAANKVDLANAKMKELPAVMINRLELNEEKIGNICKDIIDVNYLQNYTGEVIERITRPNGIIIDKVRVPFGVIAAIYESRPNVTIDVAVLCLKTKNACILKGGSEAINTNKKLVEIIKKAIDNFVPADSVTLIDSTDRAVTNELLTKKEYIDLVIPRGGKGLIEYVVSNSKIPFIETGAGNCHIFVDESANLEMAFEICINAKLSNPAVCNSVETILLHKDIAGTFLKKIYPEFIKHHVNIRGCIKTKELIGCTIANDEDYYTEYNDHIVALKIVNNIEEAINHVEKYSTKHSDAIITEDDINANMFLNQIDSACVYWNASTRFSDGGEFGFGTELGISTQKLHARGPMALKEMTTYKYKIYGKGQIR